MEFDLDNDPDKCPIARCMDVIGGKWTLLLLFRIANGMNRFGALQRGVPNISKQVLTMELRELEANGLLHRQVFAEIPPRVEYTVSAKGESLFPIINAMREWADTHQAGAAIPAHATDDGERRQP